MGKAKNVVPRVIQRYVFVRLSGKCDAGPPPLNDGDEVDPKRFLDPWEMADPPLDGLSSKQGEARRKAVEFAEKIDGLLFHCPHCENDPLCHPEDEPYIEYLFGELSRAVSAAAKYGQEISLLERLIDQDLMGDAYLALSTELTEDQHWIAFIDAARNAQQHFPEYRRIHKKAAQLLSEVSTVARQLALLLAELQRTNVRLPVELQRHDKDIEAFFSPSESQEVQHLKLLRFVERAQSQDTASAGTPLDLRSYLFKVSEIAGQLPVDFACPEVEAAISTRQNSKKSAYLRAFGVLLKNSKIKLSAPVMRAMAITANVILDDVDLSISEDTVRKALKRSQTRQKKK
ncbi:MAG: hypothetical protein K0U74_10215 [Alphaproteobacteria bacterium]|nr:hypothetical protein [Alphaproteobacteria bacterium]